MKRILFAALAIVFVLSACVIPAFAEEALVSYKLIPQGGEWTTTPYEGFDITVNVTENEAVFKADAYWPCADRMYSDEEIITVSIDDYSLVYDFTVEVGQTNINFYLTDGFGSSASYTICNNTLGNVGYDAGSGDLHAGTYTGVIRLTDFVNSNKFYKNEAFPSGIITENNELIFTGIQIYSVNGATVTINKLDLVPNEEAGDPTYSGGSEDVSEEESEAVSEEESEAVSEEESKTESKEESKTESKTESADASATESTAAEEEEGGLSTGALIAIIAAAVVVIAVVVILIVKKKK